MRIDFHCHLYHNSIRMSNSKVQPELVSELSYINRIMAELKNVKSTQTDDIIEKTIFHMNNAKIDKIVLLPINSKENFEIKQWTDRYPDKFIPFYNPPEKQEIFDTEKEKLESILKTGYYRGFKIMLPFRKKHLNDSVFYPNLELAQNYDLVVLMHTGWPPPGTNKPVLSYSNPIYLDEVVNSFPKVKFIIAHMGFPFSDIALALATQYNNIYMDISNMTYMAPYRLKELLLRAKDIIGTHKILFGSDGNNPEMMEIALNSFKDVDYLTELEIDNILGLNAKKLLNL